MHRSRLPRVPSVFCPTPATQDVVRELPPLVVLRAPRGFGKTSTVAYWLRGGALDDRSAAWLTLPGPTTATELWQAAHDSLAAAGHVSAATVRDGTTFHRALGQLTRRLVLVIDGLHHADHDVDGELVELVQAHELLHLIVISRLERPIGRIGPATVDATVLDIPQLLLTATEAGQLASRLGLTATEQEIADLVAEYAGWPALVRAALLDARRGTDGTLIIDHSGVTRYVGLVLGDPEHEQWTEVVLALAVPDPLRVEDLSVLFDRPEQRSKAEVVLAHSFTMVRTEGAARYPERLRHALLENLLSADPERYRALNERMARRRLQQGEPVEALSYATRAEAWPLVLAVLEENWAQLLRRHARQVNAVVRMMPPELVASSARLIVARDHVLDTDTVAHAEAALREGMLAPGRQLLSQSLTTTQRLALRFDGTPTYGAAELLLSRLDSELADRAVPPHSPEVQRAVPELLTQWALSLLYDNDGVGAAYGFALACQEAVLLEDDDAAREAATGAALAMALLGHIRESAAWTAYAAGFAAAPSALEVIGGPLTRTVLTGLGLGEVSWPEDRHVGAHHGLAPLVELSRVAAAFADIVQGRLDRARVELQRHAAEHGEGQERVVQASVLALQVDLALAEGRVDRAGALLVAADDDGAWTLAARARHAFYVGAYTETLRLTEEAAAYAGARPRVGLELLLLHACSAWRTGRRDEAVDHLATAVGIAADTDVLLPFLTVPRADLEAIAPRNTWSREFLDQPSLAGTDTVFPEPLRAEELSVAELRVLRELRAGVPLSHIGRILYLSESTVKTHVRRIYRKLGVSSREDALARAKELLLID